MITDLKETFYKTESQNPQHKRINGNMITYLTTQTHAENLSPAALHKIIVENKFQPSIPENKITSLGAARPGMHNIYN